MKAVIQKI